MFRGTTVLIALIIEASNFEGTTEFTALINQASYVQRNYTIHCTYYSGL